jgi:hypothetical protein
VRDASFFISGLLDLPDVAGEERRAAFRQSLAALSQSVSVDLGPGPLEGVDPAALARGVGVALRDGFVDDLDWLAPSAAGPALFELASALPLGAERRDLGRRVLSRLLDGTAETFTAIATRMARTTGKGLGTPAVAARVGLVTELPFTAGVADGALALALVSRRELSREWIETPSTGSLPSRRLAARLLERAAREASRRAMQGDPHAIRTFRGEGVRRAFERLLADRESLVWRHVAVARGLLAPWEPEVQDALNHGLDPSLTPTEWRRAATSIAAETAVDPGTALRLAAHALARGAVKRDGGVAVAFVWGAARAAEAEPDATAELVGEAVKQAPAVVAEAVLELAGELGPCRVVDETTAETVRALSRSILEHADDAAAAVMREVLRDLDRAPRPDEPLRQQLARALLIYATAGARAAYAAGEEVLAATTSTVDALAAVSKEDEDAAGSAGSLARRASLAVLRDVDLGLLERDVLGDLLALSSSAEALRAHEEILDEQRDRVTTWILAREAPPGRRPAAISLRGLVQGPERDAAGGSPGDGPRDAAARAAQMTRSLRHLRALLHLVDGDAGAALEDGARTARLRDRWRRVARALVPRYEGEVGSPLHRTVMATLARTLDALVRVGAFEPADVLLVVTRVQTQPAEIEALAEASMDPDVVHVLTRYAVFLRACAGEVHRADSPFVERVPSNGGARELSALEELAREIAPDGAGRREVLRTALVRLVTALRPVVQAPTLDALSSHTDEVDVVVALETAVAQLAQASAGARARNEPASANARISGGVPDRTLSQAVSRVLFGGDVGLDEPAVETWISELRGRIPAGIAAAVGVCVRALFAKVARRSTLPTEQVRLAEAALPSWLPPRRTLGGFHVARSLGAGAQGTVFLVRRIEDRHDATSERFALKVPDFSATAARSLSEGEFLKLFREEASALLALPVHPNLARFVTFDLSARPKPILVMELVEGTVLERVIASGVFESSRAMKVLDGVLAGLEAMHGAGVGHLDVKPSNVILRKGDEAVLVDFGLAGRHIRPGCATGPYGAPEIWGVAPDVAPTPMMADVYAWGCLAFETFTGEVLFNADNEMAQIAMHLAHDGLPPPLLAMSKRPALAALAELLFSALRKDPRARPSARVLRERLGGLSRTIARQDWPLVV